MSVFIGTPGNDVMHGTNSADQMYGLTGNDFLNGRGGADYLSGGYGADRFYMASASDANGDRISDFSRWQGDKIDLSAIDAKDYSLWSPSTWGNNTFSFVGTNSFTGKGQVNYVHSGGNTYVRGNTDSDSSAEFTVTLNGTHFLQSTDFIL